jgi:hypothetical protein
VLTGVGNSLIDKPSRRWTSPSRYAGSLILCTYPVEYLAANSPEVNPDGTSTLYNALAIYAGVRRLVTVDDPRVAADVLVRSDGRQFAWLVSHAGEPVTVKPQLSAGSRPRALDGGEPGASVTLAPFGVSVFGLDSRPDQP